VNVILAQQMMMTGASSTSTPWTPDDLTTAPAIWLDETTAVATGGSTAWTNVVGGALQFANSSTGQQPAITSGGLNGLQVMTFDGSNDWLNGSTDAVKLTNNIAALTAFVVANPTPVSGSAFARLLNFSVGTASNTSVRAGIWLTNSTVSAFQRRLDSDSSKAAAISYTSKAWHLFAAEHDWTGHPVSARMDGADTPTTTATAQGSGNTSATDSTRATIGGDPASSTQYANTGVAEVIVLKYLPTTTERQQIEGYLMWKWGLEANLPSDHPYKDAAPAA
jgi:hypothetical protein